MQTKTKRLISAVLALTMVLAWYVPSTVSAEGTTSELPFKENFENSAIVDWTSARGVAKMTQTGATVGTTTDGDANTVLKIHRTTQVAAQSERYGVYARFGLADATWGDKATFVDDYQAKTIVYHFKYKPVKSTSLQVLLRAQGTGGILSKMLEVNTGGTVKAFNNNITTSCKFVTGNWYDIALVCDFTNGTGKIWVDGNQIGESYALLSWDNMKNSQGLNAMLYFMDRESSNTTEIEYYLDDIAIYQGTEPVDQFAQPDQPENAVRFTQNFAENNYTTTAGNGFTMVQGTASYPGRITYVENGDGNHALNVTTSAASNAWQMNVRYTPTGEYGGDNADNAVGDVRGKTRIYQFMLKINTNANFAVMQRTSAPNASGSYSTQSFLPLVVKNNKVLPNNQSSINKELQQGRWYSIAIALVYPESGSGNVENHIYLDGEHLGNFPIAVGNNDLTRANYFVRFYNATGTGTSDFLLDNIAVYEASEIDDAIFGGSFTSNSVSLNAKLGVNFYTTAAGTVKVSNTGAAEAVTATSADAADSDGDWKHTVRVLPQYMMNDMTACLYDADGEIVTADTFKLSEYIAKVQAATDNAAISTLAEKTLQYCTAAAIQQGKYADANFAVSAVAPNLDDYADTLAENVKTSLVLDDACDLKIYIPAACADETLKVGGKEIGIVKDVCTLDESDNTYGYTVAAELLPQSYDKQYVVMIGEQSCQISVLGWMQRYVPNNTEANALNQLVWALYQYYEAANAMAS